MGISLALNGLQGDQLHPLDVRCPAMCLTHPVSAVDGRGTPSLDFCPPGDRLLSDPMTGLRNEARGAGLHGD